LPLGTPAALPNVEGVGQLLDEIPTAYPFLKEWDWDAQELTNAPLFGVWEKAHTNF
jgi:hypothetical protein